MPVVSVTRLHLRSIRFVPSFLVSTVGASLQVRRAHGYLGGWGSNEWPFGFWTATCWSDLAAMRAFRNDEASFTHWEQERPDVPTPAEAYRRLGEAGSVSKIAHPSPRQQSGRTVGDALPPRPGPIPAA